MHKSVEHGICTREYRSGTFCLRAEISMMHAKFNPLKTVFNNIVLRILSFPSDLSISLLYTVLKTQKVQSYIDVCYKEYD